MQFRSKFAPMTSARRPPALVDLNTPRPYWLSMAELPSPVPQYTMFVLLGATAMAPETRVDMLSVFVAHDGLAAVALVVFHTPPPAAAMYTMFELPGWA